MGSPVYFVLNVVRDVGLYSLPTGELFLMIGQRLLSVHPKVFKVKYLSSEVVQFYEYKC